MKWWERLFCFLGFHGDSDPVEDYMGWVPCARCHRCKREYEL